MFYGVTSRRASIEVSSTKGVADSKKFLSSLRQELNISPEEWFPERSFAHPPGRCSYALHKVSVRTDGSTLELIRSESASPCCCCCCCCCCSHIHSHNQVRGHRTGSSHSGVEEHSRKNKASQKYPWMTLWPECLLADDGARPARYFHPILLEFLPQHSLHTEKFNLLVELGKEQHANEEKKTSATRLLSRAQTGEGGTLKQ